MPHRYRTGERVGLAFGFHDQDAVGVYEITAVLPTRAGGQPQYVVKGADGRERVIGEGQIGERKISESVARPRSPHNPITNELNRLRDETPTIEETPAASSERSGGQLDGAPVYDPADINVGTVEQIHGSGTSLRVVVEVGGFLGIGARYVMLDASEIQFARAGDGSIRAVTTLSEAALRQRTPHIET